MPPASGKPAGPPGPPRVPITFSLYLITDEETALRPDRIAAALGALPTGMAAVQLRAKDFDAERLLDAAHRLLAVTRAHGARLFVNQRLDVAIAAGADGVHLPVRGLSPSVVRQMAPALSIGASTHSLDEARRAIWAGADFITFGPVWVTPSKIGMGEPLGIEKLSEAVRALQTPVFALGGVDAERTVECAAVGARVACLRGVLAQSDAASAARRFAAAMGEVAPTGAIR